MAAGAAKATGDGAWVARMQTTRQPHTDRAPRSVVISTGAESPGATLAAMTPISLAPDEPFPTACRTYSPGATAGNSKLPSVPIRASTESATAPDGVFAARPTTPVTRGCPAA